LPIRAVNDCGPQRSGSAYEKALVALVCC